MTPPPRIDLEALPIEVLACQDRAGGVEYRFRPAVAPTPETFAAVLQALPTGAQLVGEDARDNVQRVRRDPDGFAHRVADAWRPIDVPAAAAMLAALATGGSDVDWRLGVPSRAGPQASASGDPPPATRLQQVALGASTGLALTLVLGVWSQLGGGGDPGEPAGFKFLASLVCFGPFLVGLGALVGWLLYRPGKPGR
jgi:hypothetical protein